MNEKKLLIYYKNISTFTCLDFSSFFPDKFCTPGIRYNSNTSRSVRVALRFQAYFIYFRIDISISILLKGTKYHENFKINIYGGIFLTAESHLGNWKYVILCIAVAGSSLLYTLKAWINNEILEIFSRY